MSPDKPYLDVPGHHDHFRRRAQSRKGYWPRTSSACSLMKVRITRTFQKTDQRAYLLSRWPMSEAQKQTCSISISISAIGLGGNICYSPNSGATHGKASSKWRIDDWHEREEYHNMMISGGRA